MAFRRGRGGIPRPSLFYCVRNESSPWTEMGPVKSAMHPTFSRDASFLLAGGGTRTARELFALILELWIPSGQVRVAIQPRLWMLRSPT